jgi:hypothetical protein
MYLESYDFVSGDDLGRAQALDFGDVLQGRHCQRSLLLRAFPDTETSILDATVYLENKGGWSGAEFGCYVNPSFQPGISPGSDFLSSHLAEVQDATYGTPNGRSIEMSDSSSGYVWLDVDLPTTQVGATSSVNFRFAYNYF